MLQNQRNSVLGIDFTRLFTGFPPGYSHFQGIYTAILLIKGQQFFAVFLTPASHFQA